ncbi:MAG: flagellar biosynthetic protein FliO [Actinomycetota bacterium]|nr:flagellar biosynthetic protein FliO [Actinomycetota bacterium]
MDTLLLALRVVLSLGAVVGVLWLVQRRVTRATRGRGPADPLRVVARRGLGQKASVVVVDTGGQRFLLGVTEHAVNVLHTSEAPAEEVGADAFARLLTDGQNGSQNSDGQGGPQNSDARRVGPARGMGGPTAVPQRFRERRRGSAMDGSILSASTWRQAAAVIRKGLIG